MIYSKSERDLLLSLLIKDCGNDEIEELKKLDTSSVAFDNSFYQKRDRIIRREKRMPILKKLKYISIRVVAAILILLSMSFIAIMAIEPVREALFYSLGFNKREEYYTIEFPEHGAERIEAPNKPHTLPEGTKEKIYCNDAYLFSVEYLINGKSIIYDQSLLSGTKAVDSTDVKLYTITLDNKKIYVVEQLDKQAYIFLWTDGSYCYRLNGEDIELLKYLAKQVK